MTAGVVIPRAPKKGKPREFSVYPQVHPIGGPDLRRTLQSFGRCTRRRLPLKVHSQVVLRRVELVV